jgi:hypothetical protein
MWISTATRIRRSPASRMSASLQQQSRPHHRAGAGHCPHREPVPHPFVRDLHGKNLGYGGSAPAYTGSVVVDLKRMNRIWRWTRPMPAFWSNPASATSISTTTCARSAQALDRLPGPGLGQRGERAIDRGGGYTMASYRNHFDSHCGMEVVLPDGELLRLSMGGAIPGKDTAAIQVRLRRGSTASSRRAITASSPRWASG